ncbi:MAG: L-histidine N(alpha)-methyltransferase [Cyclonatronaceae bacterium]
MQSQETLTGSDMLADVVQGLNNPQKTLPCKYFYDKRGSELFEAICNLDEYYLTRTELKIMEHHLDEITGAIGKDVQLIELGSGSSRKTRMLLDNACSLHSYVPVDISDRFLDEIAGTLKEEYPGLSIHPVHADYTRPFDIPPAPAGVRRVVYFPGSTIGNFTKENARQIISRISGMAGDEGGLLIGYDLIKDAVILEAAYDDSQGITAEFNKNVLLHINRELYADFNISLFRHKAVFNDEKSRIEMHLVSLADQVVHIQGHTWTIGEGETIHTENSHKYSTGSFREMTAGFFDSVTTWTDPDELFCIQYLE